MYKGMGYGRSMLNYINGVSESQKVTLVLETDKAYNIALYESYGFKVVDHVKGRPNIVLMVRAFDQARDGAEEV